VGGRMAGVKALATPI